MSKSEELENLLFEKKLKRNYNIETLSALNKILYGNNYISDNVIIYGSSIYKSTARYAGDTDAMEMIFENDKKVIVKRLQEIVKNILDINRENKNDSKNQYIIGDIKLGLDTRLDNAIMLLGEIENMKIKNMNEKKLLNELAKLYKLKIFDYENYNRLIGSIKNINNEIEADKFDKELIVQSNPKLYTPDLTNWLGIKDKLRNYNVLRWKPQDILNGFLNFNNKKFKLIDCLENGMIKFDLIYWMGGQYNDVSNAMFMYINNKINMSDDKEDFQNGIKEAIFDKFYNLNYDFFKGFKLIYSLSKTTNDIKTLEVLNTMLLSNLGIVGKLKSQIGTCIDVLEYYKNSNASYSVSTMNYIVQNINQTLDMIFEFKIDEFDLFINSANIFFEFDSKTEPQIIIDTLKLIKTQLLTILNKQTVVYANQNKLYPLNKLFLP